MKTILLLALTCLCLHTTAQTIDSTCAAELRQNISFALPYNIICYATHYCNGESFIAAIAKASEDVDSMGQSVTVTIREQDVISILNILGCVQEKVAADYNQTLKLALLPLLADRPCLQEKVAAYYSDLSQLKSSIEQNGKQILDKIRELYKLN